MKPIGTLAPGDLIAWRVERPQSSSQDAAQNQGAERAENLQLYCRFIRIGQIL